MKNDFIGVVLGGDVNSYAVARAFYEEYKIKTVVIGVKPIFPTKYSKIIEGYYYEGLLHSNILLKALKNLNNKYPNKKKILFGNTDYYVRHILDNRKEIENISDTYIIPMTSLKQFDNLVNKKKFYELCDKYGLEHPKGIIFNFKTDNINKFKIPFEFPIFIKPSDSVIYSKYNFDGKQKGYKIESLGQLKKVIKDIKNSGYDDLFLFQEYIDGDDDSMYVFTCYTNKFHEVKAVTAGKILMHDRTPELIGNYNAIMNAYNKELSLKFKKFLEVIKFTGICHFDVQYDIKNDRYVVYEINIRQGRSNYYTLASKTNLMKLIVDDYIYNKKQKFFIANNQFVVSILPKLVLKYILKKEKQKIKIKNFSRFTLTPYDRNLKRYYYQYKWDKRIIRDYFKYNKNSRKK